MAGGVTSIEAMIYNQAIQMFGSPELLGLTLLGAFILATVVLNFRQDARYFAITAAIFLASAFQMPYLMVLYTLGAGYVLFSAIMRVITR